MLKISFFKEKKCLLPVMMINSYFKLSQDVLLMMCAKCFPKIKLIKMRKYSLLTLSSEKKLIV